MSRLGSRPSAVMRVGAELLEVCTVLTGSQTSDVTSTSSIKTRAYCLELQYVTQYSLMKMMLVSVAWSSQCFHLQRLCCLLSSSSLEMSKLEVMIVSFFSHPAHYTHINMFRRYHDHTHWSLF